MIEDAKYLMEILPALAEKMEYKWRVQSFSKFKPEATCVAYIDARDAMERLDKVCLYGWERDHKEIKGHLYSGVGIVMPSGRILWKWDCGTESNQDAEKGEASDSFKRACVNVGIGRFLYDLGIKKVKADKKKENGVWPHVVDNNGKQVWDLNQHINGSYKPVEKETKKPLKKSEPITVDTLIAFVNSCKTIESLNDYYNQNKDIINGFFKKEKEEVLEAFAFRKKVITTNETVVGPNSQSMQND